MFLSKYGVARHIYIPIIKRQAVDFALSADWTPAAGDVKISKDGGAAANVTNLPSAIVMGNGAIWDFSLTATEMQAAQVVVTVADSATKAVEDQSFIIQTHGNPSALFQVDLADSVRAGLTALPNAAAAAIGGLLTAPTTANVGLADLARILGTALTETAGQLAGGFKKLFDVASPVFTLLSVVQTGDNFARLGAPAGASVSADLAAINAKTTNLPPDPADESAIIAAIAAVSAPTANENADALLDRAAGVETGLTFRQAMRLIAAVLLGKASGMSSTTAVFRDTNDTKDRIQATVDADGNRSSVIRDAT
jgi:hypothetical protein